MRIRCKEDDPRRDRWTSGEQLDGFEFRCRNHPGQKYFVACGGGDPDDAEVEDDDLIEVECFHFLVRFDGENTNTCADGTKGVPEWAHFFHDANDTLDVLCTQCHENADLWDVRRNCFAEERFEGELRPKEKS